MELVADEQHRRCALRLRLRTRAMVKAAAAISLIRKGSSHQPNTGQDSVPEPVDQHASAQEVLSLRPGLGQNSCSSYAFKLGLLECSHAGGVKASCHSGDAYPVAPPGC